MTAPIDQEQVQVRQVSEDHAMAMAFTARDESLVTHDKSADTLKSAKLALRCPDTIVMLSRSKTHM